MALEFRREHLVIRVDGDVMEIFRTGRGSERILLPWLAVQVQPSIKGRLIVKIRSTADDAPLYEVVQKARSPLGTVSELVIRTEDEPLYRQFFTQVAQLSGRPVLP